MKLEKLENVVKSPSSFDSWSNYMGQTEFPSLYAVLTQNRDSDCLTRSNFTSALKMLGGESDNVHIYRFGHWACGWWEVIAVKKNTPEYAIAEKILDDLSDYPVVDEDHYSELQFNEQNEFWSSLPLSERVDICRENGISIFSARSEIMPCRESGEPVINLES